jgi:hypothetical protein
LGSQRDECSSIGLISGENAGEEKSVRMSTGKKKIRHFCANASQVRQSAGQPEIPIPRFCPFTVFRKSEFRFLISDQHFADLVFFAYFSVNDNHHN